MNTFPKVTSIVMIAAFVVSIGASMKMSGSRVDDYKIETADRADMVYMPFLGIDKFWADICWMRSINHMGGVKGKLTPAVAKYFYSQFDRIADLDPDFKLVYTAGAPFIAYQDVERALALVDKGEKCAKQSDWQRSYYAAHWILQYQARPETDEAKKKQYMENALTYLQKAIDEGGPWYVENMLLHTQAKIEGKYGDPLPELEAWYSYYEKRIGKLRSTSMAPMGPVGPDGKPVAATPGAPTPEMGMGYEAEMLDPNIERLQNRIVGRCRSMMVDFIKAGDQTSQDKVKEIFAKVTNEKHWSPYSLVAYEPGDLFDQYTGKPLEPYGIDLYHYETTGVVVPAKGDYNTLTGKKAALDFAQLAEMMGGADKIVRLKAHMPVKK